MINEIQPHWNIEIPENGVPIFTSYRESLQEMKKKLINSLDLIDEENIEFVLMLRDKSNDGFLTQRHLKDVSNYKHFLDIFDKLWCSDLEIIGGTKND